ncbi:MAG TPA: metallophosphoesterase [Alphaproteobacteria bacterium]|nr:metallophosphoesterase [Alphaproteobacteria bacterium]
MNRKPSNIDKIVSTSADGIDRRGFLQCMAWAGTGLLWAAGAGVPTSSAFGMTNKAKNVDFNFAQISDSHIGFDKPANTDVKATLQVAIDKLNGLHNAPDFIIHTGDLTHLSKPGEFDTLDQMLKSTGKEIVYVPGEHDVIDTGKQFLERYGKDPQGGRKKGSGWFSFDHKGVHFVGLVNVADLKPGGMGNLGHDQLEWLEDDLKGKSASMPVVVFAHIPLWAVYPQWGWGTEDSAQALSYLKRFGSVTVLNGHIHQIMQKVEGQVSFHTALSTAFPQPAPGSAPSPGPMKVDAGKLRDVLGITDVNYLAGHHHLAVVDATLSGAPAMANQTGQPASAPVAAVAAAPVAGAAVKIDNFSFDPTPLAVKPGASVTWTNRDDVPHNVESSDKKFSSPVLDTNQTFQFQFKDAGEYPYYCRLHPRMTGKVVVG